MAKSKLSPFNKIDFVYKTVHKTPIKTSILVPKHLGSKGREGCPTIVNWHGGGFIVGSRLYEGWLPEWLLDICITNSAIFIAPDYRLLPEATAAEIISDVGDFWHWLQNEIPSLTRDWDAHPDLTRIACTGQSAGGYLAVQSALLFGELSKIKVVASMGGSINTNIPQCRIPGPRLILGKRPPPPGKAESIIRGYLKGIQQDAVRTDGDVIEMWNLVTCVLQQAYLARWLNPDGKDELDVMKVMDETKSMPPIWLVHGQQDSVVPQQCSIGFFEKLRKTLPGVPSLLSIRPGDHGFEVQCDKGNAWIRDGVDFITQHWL
ncbi:putative polyketide synthase [Karstenula rhodostoma CBS 690.94]|uniref:Polyketide synthase n=1 Tax=Karstenula rhodostoma CBS 690.94 TaxID=1392251 RepID=A0A9P4U6V2_9PLEO|nr:putative polyketide synthase [Karstenula rhodostoma CBS 690.94]